MNVLLGAPTGSGKTNCCELAMMRLFRTRPKAKFVYVAPMKALVRERMKDWGVRLVKVLGKKVVELTGDVSDMGAVDSADVIVTTPEKWDGVSRSWHSRKYVQNVGLVVIDEIHLLGEDRGPVLEVIVSRMRYISAQTESPVRFLGMSTVSQPFFHVCYVRLVALRRGRGTHRPAFTRPDVRTHVACSPGDCKCAGRCGLARRQGGGCLQLPSQRAAGADAGAHPGLRGPVLLPAHGDNE